MSACCPETGANSQPVTKFQEFPSIFSQAGLGGALLSTAFLISFNVASSHASNFRFWMSFWE